MVQKVIDIVGISPESFAAAAQDAVRVASGSVREMRWARVSEFEMELDGDKVANYRATVRIYFDVERGGDGPAGATEAARAAPRAPRRKSVAAKKPGASRKPPAKPSKAEEGETASEEDE